jgi:glycosyltransferase involved in cell wall biosynthesis
MNTELVTVGIPFVNEERYLEAAVRSVLAQTWSNLEVLLVDDGSTDRSLEIARSFRDERVTVISDGARRYLPARLNEIVARARGTLVARMDADDVAHPERIARQVAALVEHGADACGTWAGLVDEDDEPFAVLEAADRPNLALALERAIIPHPTLLGRRKWFAAHPYDETLTRAEDRDLWLRVVATARLVVVPEPLYALHVTPRNETFLPDYLEAQRQVRTLLVRYGPAIIGWPRTARAWAASHAKEAVMRGAVATGMVDRVVRRRGRPPTERERRMILEALESGRHRP